MRISLLWIWLSTSLVLVAACGGSSKGNAGDGGSDGASDAGDGGDDGGADAAEDGGLDGEAPDENVDLSGESACCVGVVNDPGVALRVDYVGLDTGRVRLGPEVNDTVVTGEASSAGVLGGELYLCDGSDESAVAVRIDLSDGSVAATTAPCVAVTTDGTRILVLDDENTVHAYANVTKLEADDDDASYPLTGLVSRIAATSTDLVGAWHSTDTVSIGPFGGEYSDVPLDSFDDLVMGIDVIPDGRLLIVSRAAVGIVLFDSDDGSADDTVLPAGNVHFGGVACGDGPVYCPGP